MAFYGALILASIVIIGLTVSNLSDFSHSLNNMASNYTLYEHQLNIEAFAITAGTIPSQKGSVACSNFAMQINTSAFENGLSVHTINGITVIASADEPGVYALLGATGGCD